MNVRFVISLSSLFATNKAILPPILVLLSHDVTLKNILFPASSFLWQLYWVYRSVSKQSSFWKWSILYNMLNLTFSRLGQPQPPFVGSRGTVYYNWAIEAQIEDREDYCVNIFPVSNNFPCTFHNINNISYLISSGPNSPFPPCCIFAQPFHPPAPSFLRDSVEFFTYFLSYFCFSFGY